MLPPLRYTVARYTPNAAILEYWRLEGTELACDTFQQIRQELRPGEAVGLYGVDDQIVLWAEARMTVH